MATQTPPFAAELRIRVLSTSTGDGRHLRLKGAQPTTCALARDLVVVAAGHIFPSGTRWDVVPCSEDPRDLVLIWEPDKIGRDEVSAALSRLRRFFTIEVIA